MRVKKVPLQDLELWPDKVICFTAYTDTRNPVQQRRTYVDGEKLQAENTELRKLCEQMRKVLDETDTCGHCDLFSECASNGWRECEFDRRMRKLGFWRKTDD